MSSPWDAVEALRGEGLVGCFELAQAGALESWAALSWGIGWSLGWVDAQVWSWASTLERGAHRLDILGCRRISWVLWAAGLSCFF